MRDLPYRPTDVGCRTKRTRMTDQLVSASSEGAGSAGPVGASETLGLVLDGGR